MGSLCFTEKVPIPADYVDPLNLDGTPYVADKSCRCIQGDKSCSKKKIKHYCRCFWSSGFDSCFANVHKCRCYLFSFVCRRHTTEFQAESEEDVCVICFSDFYSSSNIAVSLIPCGHNYHNLCIKQWFSRRHNKCPICSKVVF